ncbi:HAD family hydrolase [Romeria aff. gracilis LEGE 07310]|uniref:HAD family hydrolase n=1 Tax=Vasconcelosia minhoensis LEGE 07310 TaxID=915328 RepID=A0A8J7A9V5_9CYAN|nr:HAD family hydrolase [Romeria gracilis]MBE9080042.1 HAD family hydrolase [Romeria aff. gracilis LEGE 07310]
MFPAFRDRSCWIFDMDGTLTVGIHDFDAIRRELGLPANEPILEALAQLSAAEAVPLRRRLADIETELAHRSQAQPGIHPLLSKLRSQGKRLGVLTRNGKQMAHTTLAACGLNDFFAPENVLSRDCCAHKPSPDGILKLLDRWQAAPTEAVMVGDYKFDLMAGRNAGTATAYFDSTGEFPWREYADVWVRDLGALVDWVGE